MLRNTYRDDYKNRLEEAASGLEPGAESRGGLRVSLPEVWPFHELSRIGDFKRKFLFPSMTAGLGASVLLGDVYWNDRPGKGDEFLITDYHLIRILRHLINYRFPYN